MNEAEKANAEVLSLLRGIAADVQTIKGWRALVTATPSATLPSTAEATDYDLDGQYGDPTIKNDPRRWDGESFAGFHYSETTPEYLDCVAGFKDWQAGKDEESGAKDAKGRPKAQWARKDAKLARGWARRLRGGWKPNGAEPAPVQGGSDPADYGSGEQSDANDDLPF